jgi:hypothetical protein
VANEPNHSEPAPPVSGVPSTAIPAATPALSQDSSPNPQTGLAFEPPVLPEPSAAPAPANSLPVTVPDTTPASSQEQSLAPLLSLVPVQPSSGVPATTTQLAPSSKGTTPSKTTPKSNKKTVVANKSRAESKPNYRKSLIEKGSNWFKGLLLQRGSGNSGWNDR